jgi:hypothetical protein
MGAFRILVERTTLIGEHTLDRLTTALGVITDAVKTLGLEVEVLPFNSQNLDEIAQNPSKLSACMFFCHGDDDKVASLLNNGCYLEEFITGGGGCFATGDHGRLGEIPAGRIFGIRQMRQWGTPNNPSTEFPSNIDTRLYSSREEFLTGNKRLMVEFSGGKPHPLLTHRGEIPILELPDHQHEGKVDDCASSDLNGAGSLRTVAYTLARTNNRIEAVGVVRAFEPSGRYGRLVVDSTIHHWLDASVALLSPDSREQAVAYYRNVALFILRYSDRLARVEWMLRRLARTGLVQEYIGTTDVGAAAERVLAGLPNLHCFARQNEDLLRQCADCDPAPLERLRSANVATHLNGSALGAPARSSLSATLQVALPHFLS